VLTVLIGFLFPLVASGKLDSEIEDVTSNESGLTLLLIGTCTLREAHIVSGVLSRVSIPVLHSAAAIKTLCDIAAEQASQSSECVSATNLLLKTLLEKRYALRKTTSKSAMEAQH